MKALIRPISSPQLSTSPSFLNQHRKTFAVNNTEDKGGRGSCHFLGTLLHPSLGDCSEAGVHMRTSRSLCAVTREKKRAWRTRLQRGASEGSTKPPDQYSIWQTHVIVTRCSARPYRRSSLRSAIIFIWEKWLVRQRWGRLGGDVWERRISWCSASRRKWGKLSSAVVDMWKLLDAERKKFCSSGPDMAFALLLKLQEKLSSLTLTLSVSTFPAYWLNADTVVLILLLCHWLLPGVSTEALVTDRLIDWLSIVEGSRGDRFSSQVTAGLSWTC